jgi:hypothetical protein
LPEMREALEAWAKLLESIVGKDAHSGKSVAKMTQARLDNFSPITAYDSVL